MATTTATFGYTKPAEGDLDWDTTLNTNFDLIDEDLAAEHESDGTHGAITPTSVTSSGKVTVTSTSGIEIDVASGDPVIVLDTQGADKFYIAVDDSDSDKFMIGAGGTVGTTPRLVIDSNGLVGIGSTAPEAKLHIVHGTFSALHIERTTTVTNTIASTMLLETTTSGDMADGFGGGIIIGLTDTGYDSTGANGQARIYAVRDGSDSTASLGFYTTTLTGDANPKMIIKGTGNVGIGITAPAAKLHVDQASTTGAVPVLTLDQADVSEEFIRFIGTSTTDASQSLVDAADMTTPGSIVGWVKVYIQDDQGTNPITDGAYFIPFYSAPTS